MSAIGRNWKAMRLYWKVKGSRARYTRGGKRSKVHIPQRHHVHTAIVAPQGELFVMAESIETTIEAAYHQHGVANKHHTWKSLAEPTPLDVHQFHPFFIQREALDIVCCR